MLTERCNLQCPYCFACYEHAVDEIAIEDFVQAVRFIRKDPYEKIGILGGEPLLHTQFGRICEWIIGEDTVPRVVLFTNGLLLDRYISILKHEKFAFLINFNGADTLLEKQILRLRQNIEALVAASGDASRIQLGLNIFKPNMQIDDLLDTLKLYGMPKLRVSLIIPTQNARKGFLAQYKLLEEELFSVFSRLAQIGVLPQYDCNRVPPCFYSKARIAQLKELFGDKLTATNLLSRETSCKPVIDIYPSMKAARCFGCSEPRVPIRDFLSISDMKRYFFNKVDKHAYDFCEYETGDSCYLRNTMMCAGGCLTYRGRE